MSQDENKVLGHDYDGIREYDNPLPNWWLMSFFATIIFSFLYWVHYEIAGGPNLDQELALAMKTLKSHQGQASPAVSSEEDILALEKDSARLQEAGASFQGKCASCHGDKLQGLIGPNLTDDYWLHGDGSGKAIAHVIREGVPDKGMPPWAAMLSEKEVAELAAYIRSVRGSQPANAKAPQGEKVN